MGLTSNSSGLNLLRESFNIDSEKANAVIALAGNPNTGKSTIFNNLTGLKQHTGNWPGKTVTQARGYYTHQGDEYTLVDLPGTYSLLANSSEEQVARDFICFAKPDATIVVVDATNLERNLNLVLQVAELTDNIILCLNLMDEANRKKIKIDIEGLEKDLQMPVIPTVARDGIGLDDLKDVITDIVTEKIKVEPTIIQYSPKLEAAISQIEPDLEYILQGRMNARWLALRLLEGDKTILESMEAYYSEEIIKDINAKLEGEVKASGVL
ncbi:FeoB small GTPase domain-containing protein [Selenihalanaerobacter shriftii]|uniref:Small GTP-binding protein domain-containing protein n=1 Tax=Selenihalanaerobacter shriftii TaxID=142842 RepID=A0A1T4PQ26_9FIRM|nr:FeoB small GTPase domain-containing protein [Selenihalanaerobacter shriftii]SJZ93623.1 small GTP-binding protein domain-containing protein [Selenihalanaerobacter shriftii]